MEVSYQILLSTLMGLYKDEPIRKICVNVAGEERILPNPLASVSDVP